MAKDSGKDTITEVNDAPEVEEAQTAMVPAMANVPATVYNPDFDSPSIEVLAEIEADIQSTLRQLSVTKIEGASKFLDKVLNLMDAFHFELTEKDGGSKLVCVSVVEDTETGGIHFVAQAPNPTRNRFVALYDKLRQASAVRGLTETLTVTNVKFVEVEGGKAGNKPIILQLTPESVSLRG